MKRFLVILLGCCWSALPLLAEDVAEDFKRNCATCHTIGGGRLTGPDLKDVGKRRDIGWLVQQIQDPRVLVQRGDPVMMDLMREYPAARMPAVAGMTPERARSLLTLIEEESKLEKSRFSGLSLIDRPLTPRDVEDGKALFLGATRLKNGGPSCLSCHSVGGLKGLGGGALGPDLTRAFSSLGGEKALAAWLMSPATATMQPIYQKHPLDPQEILPLVAFLKDAAERGHPAGTERRLSFLIAGVAGALLLFVVFDAAWRNRLRAVRRKLLLQKPSSEANHE